jgi:hypothetical protein
MLTGALHAGREGVPPSGGGGRRLRGGAPSNPAHATSRRTSRRLRARSHAWELPPYVLEVHVACRSDTPRLLGNPCPRGALGMCAAGVWDLAARGDVGTASGCGRDGGEGRI